MERACSSFGASEICNLVTYLNITHLFTAPGPNGANMNTIGVIYIISTAHTNALVQTTVKITAATTTTEKVSTAVQLCHSQPGML